MSTAFVLCGGGNLGAVQVGMLHALFAAGIHPDVIVGTSVGAFNGAWVAGRGPEADIDELAAVWRGLRRSDVFPTRLLGGLRGFHRADRSPRPVLG
ncbi:MAG: patatin-like phospholipase family protein, partial [Acidimicrobiia bacterium]|nr:patatin-like phospholipase family protein [Acidimicrobiia bacterium]